MAHGDSIACSPGDATKISRIARGVLSNMLLLECPSRLNGIEVGGVRRQVQEADAGGLAELGDDWCVVGRGVVHDQDVAAPQLGQQPRPQPPRESLAVGRGEHGPERDPTGQADRSDQGEVLAPVDRHALLVLHPALDPSVAASHRAVQAGLVEEDQALDRDPGDDSQERLALQDDVGSERLQRPAAFFLTTYPKRWSARFMLETCTRDRPRRPLLNRAVSSPAFASPRARRISSTSLNEMREWFPPPLRDGDSSPVHRDCRSQRLRLAVPTTKAPATSRRLPVPDSYASTARTRSSSGYASAIPAADQMPIHLTTIWINPTERWD
jgi:hypothetical protein